MWAILASPTLAGNFTGGLFGLEVKRDMTVLERTTPTIKTNMRQSSVQKLRSALLDGRGADL